jgi:glycosyltransferase involved in cell wall biosynthesis
MRILFIHQNFPGQYKHLAPALAANPENEVLALAMNKSPAMPGVKVIHYQAKRGSSKSIHPWVADMETKVIRGEAALNAASKLKEQGFTPDIICAHPGWGEALFVKDVWPSAKLLSFIEFYYIADGGDYNFDPEFSDPSITGRCRLRMKNANHLLSLDACDWGLSPTQWQMQTVPKRFHEKMSVIHDGVDTQLVRPNPNATISLQQKGLTLKPGDEVITFVNRNMEPYRGFHIFMRALPEIQRRRPNAMTIIVGGDEVSYGKALEDGQTYRSMMLKEVGAQLDMERVRFVGRVPYDDFLRMLQVSAAHVYLTYPFVLSWSMLEAMAAGCALVGSATQPVEEVIQDGVNGLLVDFFSPTEIADAIDRVLDAPDRMQAMREAARQTVVERYDLKSVCLPRHIELVYSIAKGKKPQADPAAAVATANLRQALAAKTRRQRQKQKRGRK